MDRGNDELRPLSSQEIDDLIDRLTTHRPPEEEDEWEMMGEFEEVSVDDGQSRDGDGFTVACMMGLLVLTCSMAYVALAGMMK